MINTELGAAGIDDEGLRESYRYCRQLNAEHGRTYFLATRLLAPSQRPAVHALYGFARYADDILDDLQSDAPVADREARLERLAAKFFDGADDGSEPVLPAVLHTARKYRIPLNLFDDFLTSMRMDLTVTDYPDRAALDRYVRGSAEVIGLQMLPILGTVGPLADAEPYAEALGQAFQLTNFLRDINEDLERNRVYLPADELAAFGVDRALLQWCHDNRRTDPRVRQALEDQHATTRAIYRTRLQGHRAAGPGVTAVRDGRLHAVLGDPRPHRGHRLRRFQPAGVGGGRPSAAGVHQWADPGQAGPTVTPRPERFDNPGRCLMALMGLDDTWQYLLLLAGCVVITAPLELLGEGVYRQPGRLLRAMMPVVTAFLIWDAIAISLHVWSYNPRYVSGIDVPFMPLEELLFFIVIPVCGLLTYNAVTTILEMLSRWRAKTPELSVR